MKPIVMQYLTLYVLTLFFFGFLLVNLKKLNRLEKKKFFNLLLVVVMPSVVLFFFIKTIVQWPFLFTALDHYKEFQTLESTVVEKIVVKKYLVKAWGKRRNVIEDKNQIKAILSSIQTESKPVPEDWGAQNRYGLEIFAEDKIFYFEIIKTDDDDFDVIYLFLKKNDKLFSIGDYANYDLRSFNLFEGL